MSNVALPVSVDAIKFADQDVEIKGVLAVGEFKRLVELLLDSSGEASIDLRFFRDEMSKRVIQGTVSVTVKLECQRCLDEVDVEIRSDINLALVFSDEEAKALPKEYDPLIVVPDEEISLVDLVEEELLLNLPDFAYHENDDCGISYKKQSDDLVADEVKKENPFSVLNGLKFKK